MKTMLNVVKAKALPVFLLMFFLSVQIVLADQASTTESKSEKQKAVADSISQWKNNNLKPSAIEWTGSAFGDVLYFPLWLSFTVTKEAVAWVDDTKIIAKVNDRLESDDGKRKLEPITSPKTGLGVRINFQKLVTDSTKLSFAAAVGHNEMQNYYIDLENMPLYRGKVMGGLKFQKSILPEKPFYGFSAITREIDETYFRQEYFIGESSFELYLKKWLSLYSVIGYELHNAADTETDDPGETTITDLFPAEMLTGFDKNLNFLQLRLGMRINNKNHPGNPSAGYEADIAASIYEQANGDEYGFYKGMFDVSKYLHLFRGRILVLRARAELTETNDEYLVPFYYLSELGSTGTIRGFDRGRFHDMNSLMGSLEYRFPLRRIWSRSGIDFLVFADGGKVSSEEFEDINDTPLQGGFGFGVRYWNNESETARVEVGISNEEVRLYLVVGL